MCCPATRSFRSRTRSWPSTKKNLRRPRVAPMPSGAGLRQFYYHAPGAVRTLMAAAYSLRENRRKFTRYTEACFAEIQQTECWDTERQRELQAARLDEMLDHACRRVPFYKRLVRDLDLGAGR